MQSVPETTLAERTGPERAGPERTCVGCHETASPAELVRLTLSEGGELAFDGPTRAPGRGAWLHAKRECVRRSAPRGLSRAFKRTVSLGPRELSQAARRRAEQWVVELLVAARGRRRLVTGVSACQKAWSEGSLGWLVLARDAVSLLREERWLGDVIGAGRALSFATRAELAAGLGPDACDLSAVLDEGLSDALSGLLAIGQLSWDRREGARPDSAGQDSNSQSSTGQTTTSVILEAG